jgi:hypothetical protein
MLNIIHEVKIKKPAKEISNADFSHTPYPSNQPECRLLYCFFVAGLDRIIDYMLLSEKQHKEANRLILNRVDFQFQISG